MSADVDSSHAAGHTAPPRYGIASLAFSSLGGIGWLATAATSSPLLAASQAQHHSCSWDGLFEGLAGLAILVVGGGLSGLMCLAGLILGWIAWRRGPSRAAVAGMCLGLVGLLPALLMAGFIAG